MEGYRYEDFEIPANILKDIRRYVTHGQKVGDFLKAVISNNLVEAVLVADHFNKKNLPAFAAFMEWETPYRCWGTHAKYVRWVQLGGELGIAKKEAASNQPEPEPPKELA